MAWDHLTGKQFGENAPRYKHGEAASRTPEYRSWRSMRTRCENPNHRAFHNYGGRGIKVCERWREYENFLADMGRRPSLDFTLDRIDPDGDYEPGNCRWADRKDQQSNRRAQFQRFVEWQGRKLTVAQAARLAGINRALMRWRLDNGWSIQRAMKTPPTSKSK